MNRFCVTAAAAALLLGTGCGGETTPPPAGLDAGTFADAAAPVAINCSILTPAEGALVGGAVNVEVGFEGPVTKIELLA
ncbi:MAG: hypothetical protein HY901_27650, partial [Deltaproteobacteria bacterium]|nr:hypothetical protein [Deltaproteobacteria bacterium]